MDNSSLKINKFGLSKILLFGLCVFLILWSSVLNANMLLKKRSDWSFSSGEKINAVEVSNNGTAFIFSKDELNVFDRFGTLVWKFHPFGNEIKGYSISDDIIYIRTDDILYSLNADGTERWRFQAPDNEILINFELGMEGDMYVHTTTEFYSLDPVDGQENWHYSSGEKINSYKLLETEGLVYLITSNSVYALDAFSNS